MIAVPCGKYAVIRYTDIPELEEVPAILAPPTTDGDDTSFVSLSDVVCDKTLRAVTDSMGFTHMTEVQQRSIRPLLEGRCVSCPLSL